MNFLKNVFLKLITSLSWLWTSAWIVSDIQYVCRISFSPWIEMLTFAVKRVGGRRWSDVPCHSLAPHSIAPPRGKLQIFPTFSATMTSFSRTVACSSGQTGSCPWLSRRVRRVESFLNLWLWRPSAQLLHLCRTHCGQREGIRNGRDWRERGEITRCYFNKNFLLDFDLITVQPFRFSDEQCARICGLCNQYLAKISDLGKTSFFWHRRCSSQ